MNKKVLLVIANEGFQPIEYGTPKKVLELASIKVATASDKKGTAVAAYTGEEVAVDLTLAEIRVDDYDGIFFIGGPGALEHLDNEKSYQVIKEVFQSGKPWGAICISPRILARAGVLAGKKVTGWDGDNELGRILASAGAEYARLPVVVDDNLLTANGPSAAEEWGKKIVEILQSA